MFEIAKDIQIKFMVTRVSLQVTKLKRQETLKPALSCVY